MIMIPARNTLAMVAGLLSLGILMGHPDGTARASGFTAFAEDEGICRRVGAQAIDGASGASAAQRYDGAYRRCMAMHANRRRMARPEYGFGPADNSQFPDAYYSIPYATPGYGYDGFSW